MDKLPKHYSFKSHVNLNPTYGWGKYTLCYKRWWMDDYEDVYTVYIFHKPSYQEEVDAHQELIAQAWYDKGERPFALKSLWHSIVQNLK